MPTPIQTLAQPAPARGHGDTGGVILWIGVLIAVIMVGFVALMWVRRRMFMGESDQSGGLMDSLRKMRDTGQMSQQEYDAARKAMVARIAKGNPAKKPQSPDN